jgi:integrase
MATVYIQKRKRNNGMSYLVSYYDPIAKRKEHYKTFKKQREAQREANDLRAILDSGKKPVKKDVRFTPLTFRKVAKALKAEWRDRLQKKDLAIKTVSNYEIWLDVLERDFGDKILHNIKNQDIAEYRDEIARNQTNVNANKYLSVFKKLFAKGLELKAVIDDPAAGIPYLSEKHHIRNSYLMPPSLDNLIKATQGTRAKFYMPSIILLGAEHGACKQEILDLRWSKIVFDFKSIGLITLFRTKNSRERTEFLMARTRTALLDWQAHLEHMRHRRKIRNVKSDYVFCRLDGTPIKSFNKAWWHALKVANIKNFHFHDLRHTFCSNLLLAGGTLKHAKDMIGHSDISMTDRYAHLHMSEHHKIQRQLAEHYAQKS